MALASRLARPIFFPSKISLLLLVVGALAAKKSLLFFMREWSAEIRTPPRMSGIQIGVLCWEPFYFDPPSPLVRFSSCSSFTLSSRKIFFFRAKWHNTRIIISQSCEKQFTSIFRSFFLPYFFSSDASKICSLDLAAKSFSKARLFRFARLSCGPMCILYTYVYRECVRECTCICTLSQVMGATSMLMLARKKNHLPRSFLPPIQPPPPVFLVYLFKQVVVWARTAAAIGKTAALKASRSQMAGRVAGRQADWLAGWLAISSLPPWISTSPSVFACQRDPREERTVPFFTSRRWRALFLLLVSAAHFLVRTNHWEEGPKRRGNKKTAAAAAAKEEEPKKKNRVIPVGDWPALRLFRKKNPGRK